MSIYEQAERLARRMSSESITQDTDNKQFALSILREVARDQRNACAESLHTVGHDGFLRYEETHQAVINAEIK